MKPEEFKITKPLDSPPTRLASPSSISGSITSSNCTDFPISITEKYISDFNKTFEEFVKNKSEDGVDTLNRCLALLASSINPLNLNLDKPEIARLFVNLHRLLENVESSRSALLWSAIAFLEQVVQNSLIRSTLVDKFKFMQILSKLLESVNNPDRVEHILRLIENISYGISITWMEPYLKDLIRVLVKFVVPQKLSNSNDNRNNNFKLPALAALINLCYRNLPSIYILNKTISTEKLLSAVQNYGILTFKMNYILENNFENPQNDEIHSFIKLTFMEVEKAIKSSNSGLLRHTIDFFKDLKENLKQNITDYTDYCENIQSIVTFLSKNSKASDDENNTQKQYELPLCVSVLFEFLKDLLQTSSYRLKAFVPAIIKCSLDWINTEEVAIKSLELLLTVMKMNETWECLEVQSQMDIFNGVMHAILIFETIEISFYQKIALLNLLLEILRQESISFDCSEKLEHFLMKSIFNDILDANLNGTLSPINDECTKMYVLGIEVMKTLYHNFPENNQYLQNLQNLFNLPTFHFIAAKAMLSGDFEISTLIFDFSKLDFFPTKYVSKQIIAQRNLMITKESKLETNPPQYCGRQQFFPNDLVAERASAESARIDELISEMFTALRNKEIENVLTSNVMELFELKLKICSSEERDLIARIDECNRQITNLSQKESVLLAEIVHYQTENLYLQISIERTKAEKLALENENSKLIDDLNNSEVSIVKEKAIQTNLLKEIEEKNNNIKELKEELMMAASRARDQSQEISDLQLLISKESVIKTSLEKKQSNLEAYIVKLHEELHEKQECIISQNMEIETLEKAKFSAEKKLSETETSLSEKELLLQNLVKDLKDVDEMRNQVVTLIQRKKNLDNSDSLI